MCSPFGRLKMRSNLSLLLSRDVLAAQMGGTSIAEDEFAMPPKVAMVHVDRGFQAQIRLASADRVSSTPAVPLSSSQVMLRCAVNRARIVQQE